MKIRFENRLLVCFVALNIVIIGKCYSEDNKSSVYGKFFIENSLQFDNDIVHLATSSYNNKTAIITIKG